MLQNYRKYIVIGVFVSLVVFVGWLIYGYFNSFQKVTINYDNADITSLDIYEGIEIRGVVETKGEKKQSIEPGKEYTLQKGLYALKPAGEKIVTDIIRLEVADTRVTKDIDLDYKASYLVDSYNAEIEAITQVLTAYPGLTDFYTINRGELYHKAEFYGTTLSYKGTNTLERDTLRVVLENKDGVWSIVVTPRIIISAKDFPKIPVATLRKINTIDLGPPLMPGMQPDPVITVVE